jgi:hypothetical protein
MNEDLIDVLILMGATKVEYKEEDRCDDLLTFNYRDKRVEIRGCWNNDSTGGIVSEVIDA